MNPILDPSLIKNFREKANEDRLFQQLYKNIDGKNKWNIICSAMDWIDTIVEGIESIQLKRTGLGFNAIQSLNLMQYVISLDLLVQSIIKLYDVIDNGTQYKLYTDQSVFNKGINDDLYFKQIRAVFGTHPIDLHSADGAKKTKGEKFYASWSATGSLENNDFHVMIYSDDPAKDEREQIEFGISINEINEYAEKRYQLLTDLSIKVDQILQTHIATCRAILIPSTSNSIDQLDILLEENKKRFSETYGHVSTIRYIQRMLKTELSKEADVDPNLIKDYKAFLTSLIPDIKKSLQIMDIRYFKWNYTHVGKEIERIQIFMHDFRNDHGLVGQTLYEELIKKDVLPSYLLTNFKKDEMQLVFDATLHREFSRLNKRVKYEDLIELEPQGQE